MYALHLKCNTCSGGMTRKSNGDIYTYIHTLVGGAFFPSDVYKTEKFNKHAIYITIYGIVMQLKIIVDEN